MPGLGCGRAPRASLGMGSRVLLGLLGAGIGCREPELSHRPLVAAVLWEQPEVAQQRFGKVSPEWSSRSLSGGRFAAQTCVGDRKSLGCHTQRGVLLSLSLHLLSTPDIPNPCGRCCSRSAEHRAAAAAAAPLSWV